MFESSVGLVYGAVFGLLMVLVLKKRYEHPEHHWASWMLGMFALQLVMILGMGLLRELLGFMEDNRWRTYDNGFVVGLFVGIATIYPWVRKKSRPSVKDQHDESRRWDSLSAGERYTIRRFMSLMTSGMGNCELPVRARPFIRAGEHVRLIGRGPARILIVPCAASAISLAALAVYVGMGGPRVAAMWVVVYISLAFTIATPILFWWMARGGVVIVSDERFFAVWGLLRGGIVRWTLTYEVAISEVANIIVIKKRITGLWFTEYALELSHGSVRRMGIMEFEPCRSAGADVIMPS